MEGHKKGQPYGCPFLWPSIHRLLPAKKKEREKTKNLTSTGQAQHFFGGPSEPAALPQAATRHPP
ncbi:hypothetical protein, partial [Desulfovibrio sp.]|uniref:hypothetical protein n=1 Tax=Desulfovibrio sp. TaxID=885 RepID=UPI00257958AF